MALAVQNLIKSASTGGITGLVAYGISLALSHYGVTIPPDQLVTIITVLVGIVSHAHFVSLNLKQHAEQINATVQSVASNLPAINYAPADFPATRNGGTSSN